MKVRILGAHNLETGQARHTCFLVDGVMALDAGSLMTALSLEELKDIRVVLLTHRHFDHVRDLPSLGLATIDQNETTILIGLSETLKAVSSRLMDGVLYPDFTEGLTRNRPRYRLQPITAGEAFSVNNYIVKPISVPHTAPAVGYIVHQPGGNSFGYCGDTVGGLLPFFQDPLRPDPLFVEVTFPRGMKELAELTGHLTPDSLGREIATAVRRHAPMPRIMVIHRSPVQEGQIVQELKELSAETGVEIAPAHEDETIEV